MLFQLFQLFHSLQPGRCRCPAQSKYIGNDIHGNIQRIDNCLEKIGEQIQPTKEQLENEKVQLHNAEIEVQKEFPQELELIEKQKRLDELNIKLNLNEKEHELLENEVEDEKSQVCKDNRER